MPFAPDYSDFLRMKRIQKTIDVDSRIDARKTRSTYAFGAYNPTYKIGYLPPNLFLPGRLYPSPAPPAPEPPTDFVNIITVDIQPGASLTVSLEFNLVNPRTETSINWGDGTIETILSNTPISNRYQSVGRYAIKISEPTNISGIDVSPNESVTGATLDNLTELSEFLALDCTALATITFPPSVDTLDIRATAVTSVTIPYGSNLTTLRADGSSLETIGGEFPDSFSYLSITYTAINTCQDLESLVARLPTLPLTDPLTGTMDYSETTPACPLSREGWNITAF